MRERGNKNENAKKGHAQRIIDLFAHRSYSASVERLFYRWLAAANTDDDKEKALSELWAHSSSESRRVESALADMHRRMFGQPRPMRATAGIRRWAIAAAAAVLVITSLSALLYTRWNSAASVEWEQMSVPYGQRKQLTLADGTRLWVGAGTQVIYPLHFKGRERKVFVNGEIYAEVAHDPHHPFVFATGDANVRVLGTTFSLCAYGNDRETELLLVDGRVNFEINGSAYHGVVELSPGERIRYNRIEGRVDKTRFNVASYYSWAKDGELCFFKETLGHIVSLLSRRFDRQIILPDPVMQKEEFYVFLSRSASLDDVLRILAMNNSIRIYEERGLVYIVGKEGGHK